MQPTLQPAHVHGPGVTANADVHIHSIACMHGQQLMCSRSMMSRIVALQCNNRSAQLCRQIRSVSVLALMMSRCMCTQYCLHA